MILVDPKMFESSRIPCVQQPLENPIANKLCDLDDQMRSILTTPNTPASEKVLLYKNVLQKYLSYADKYAGHPKYNTPPTPSQQHTPPPVESTPELSAIDQRVIDSVPPTFARKAKVLLNHFKTIPELEWNDKGEVIYRKQRIANSSMIDIVNDLMRSRKHRPEPIGWATIKKVLKESNAPRELISHDARWRSVQSQIPVPTPKRYSAFPSPSYSSDSEATPIAGTPKRKKSSSNARQSSWLSFTARK